MDNEGFLYFVDRIGDTYRWKGQNVATTEISKVIGKFKGIGEANCYGVPVPGHDGKCGMVAILRSEEELNFKDLYSYSINNLTNYQVPCFLRIQTQFNNTGTFKYKKTDLVKDGFDISKTKDEIFIKDDNEKTFIKVDDEIIKKLNDKKYKL